ncbi:hypothetical protein DEU56DRAFT_362282 [Suillus clintonianus]|uniref:uncharacterized protein n=1 Tax=Suillus clintonianus TaxID=1904413 RepID=UPI001B870EDF|nr:uncharacterized protein DEU56DRAFT_362282 [Suillus clintonianus]KAG2136411.1 hypothetical protein DEU56DRAFT_362282 [Suillus clintonianus]
MFNSSNHPTPRKRAASHSTDQTLHHHHHPYVHERLPSSPANPFYAQPHEPSTSSNSLRRSASRHPYVQENTQDRIHPSLPSPHNPSPQSSPVTSPSSAHGGSSRFADSQSSFTSESASADPWHSPSVLEQNRMLATSRQPHFSTPPSPAISGRSRSITESDLLPMHGATRKRVSKYPSSSARPRTAPNSPSHPTLETPESPVAMGIKFFLSKPALPSPSRLSLHSDSGASSRSRLTTPRKSRPHPPELDVSAFPFTPGYSHPDHATRGNSSPPTSVPLISQDSLSLSTNSVPAQGKEQRQRNVLRRKPSAKVKREMEMRQRAASAQGSERPLRDPPLTPASTVVRAYKQREDTQPMEGDPPSPSPIPYYTVYGTQSEHRVAAGGPDDNSNWSLHAHVLAEQRAQTEPSRSLSRKGSLSRRVSSKWKKATGGVKAEESPSHGHSIGRSSLQESHSSSRIKDRGQSMNAGQFGKGHTRSATDPQSKSEGSKIWKLMKRISTGGLRDRFHADTAPPPVPAIPKELLNSPPPRSQTVHRDAQATSHKPYNASMPRSIAGSGPRPSMATSSSSPNSSEMASASFFHTSHSRGSSVSSYGEETAPPFLSMGDRHIVPPREFNHILGDHTKDQGLMSRSGSHGQIYSGRATPEADDQHQDTSPRTHTHTFPITHPIHSLTSLRTHRLGEKPSTAAYTHLHLLPDGNTSLSPPPRPARSAMRSSSFSGEHEYEHSPSRSTFDEESTSRDGVSPSLRASSAISEASTAKMESWSRSSTSTSKAPSASASPSQLRSAINYRELNAPRRPPLTEREKAEIWDDLLERSALAGGTLHLGGSGELESDNLRFSSCSEHL